jgi:transaldolase
LGIAGMANEFGLKPWQFGENLQDGYQKIDLEQVGKEPLKLAEDYTEKSPRLGPDSAAMVLEHVKRLVAVQIAHDPKVSVKIPSNKRKLK